MMPIWVGYIIFFAGLILGAEFFGRNRTIKMKCGEIEIEARSVQELTNLMDVMAKRNPPQNPKTSSVN